MVPLKAFSDQVWIKNIHVEFWKTGYFQLWFLYKNDFRFLLQESVLEFSQFNTFRSNKDNIFHIIDKEMVG